MRCITSCSPLATLLLFFCSVEWIIGVPVPNDGNGSASGHSSNDQAPPANQAIPFREFQNESSNYVVVDDMIINKDAARAGLVDMSWPNGVVPYTFALTIAPYQRNDILQAMKELQAVSCVKFRPATKEDTYNIEYRNDPMNQGCSSFVGWQNRKNQPVQLSSICSKGNAIHEILHALGFFHEQTRNDRDDYVTINFQNIQPGFENNFKKDSELYANYDTDYFGVPYNYDSIMHYGKTYFSKNQQNTIDVKENPTGEVPPIGNPDNLGQRDFISQGDIDMLNTKYNCIDNGITSPSNNPDEGTTEASSSVSSDPDAENNEEIETEPTTAASTKPTTKNPMCQYNPGLPMCKQ